MSVSDIKRTARREARLSSALTAVGLSYALGRSFLALGTLLALITEAPDQLFRPFGVLSLDRLPDGVLAKASLYSLLSGHLWIASTASIVVLLLAILGWRPRVIGPLQWYVHASFAASCVSVEGGDQITAILALFLLPITSFDGRRSHWSERGQSTPRAQTAAAVGWALIQLQISVLYTHSALGKMFSAEWANGTAMYYWLDHPIFGMVDGNWALLQTVSASPTLGPLLTWSVMGLEVFLAACIISRRRWHGVALVAGLSLHVGIALTLGLVSFGFAMIGALFLYLGPTALPLLRAWRRAGAAAVQLRFAARDRSSPDGARSLQRPSASSPT